MSEALETLRKYCATLPRGRVQDPTKLRALLRPCWNEFIGDEDILTFVAGTFVENVEWNRPYLTYEINPGGNTSNRWRVDIDHACAERNPNVEFDEILKHPSARKLITAKLHPPALAGWLHEVAKVPPKKRHNREGRYNAAKSLAKRCFNLAQAIAVAPRPLGMDNAEYGEWDAMPELLEHFAQTWKRAHARRISAKVFDPRAERICMFIDAVKFCTGHEHYSEIADLLNLINEIPRYRHPRKAEYDADNLKQMVHRNRIHFLSMVPESERDYTSRQLGMRPKKKK